MSQVTQHHSVADENSTLYQLQNLIAEVTGADPEEVTSSTYLEEFSLVDFPKIVRKINAHFGIMLNPKTVLDDYETIEELASLIEEEIDLG